MNLFSVSWWVNMFITTIVTMCFIYIIKVAAAKVTVPVLSDVAAAV